MYKAEAVADVTVWVTETQSVPTLQGMDNGTRVGLGRTLYRTTDRPRRLGSGIVSLVSLCWWTV